MRRARVMALGPLALYATGCASSPFTPAVPVVSYGQDASDSPNVATIPARVDAMARWQLPPENPWAVYQKLTLFAALDDEPRPAVLPEVGVLEVVGLAREAGANVASAGLPTDTLWIVDLRGAASVVFGSALSRRARTVPSLVLTFNNWPAEDELIPAEETLAALVHTRPQQPDAAAAAPQPVFLLDSWRLAFRDAQPDPETTDNRYFLSSSDLPSVEVLRARGIRRVVYVVENLDDVDTEEDDLNLTFLDYQREGLALSMVDLGALREPIPDAAAWDTLLTDSRMRVERRYTVIDDPAFFGRARGGFGGVHGGPAPVWHWSGTHHFIHFGGGG